MFLLYLHFYRYEGGILILYAISVEDNDRFLAGVLSIRLSLLCVCSFCRLFTVFLPSFCRN